MSHETKNYSNDTDARELPEDTESFNYSYKFPTGEIFEAVEKEDGGAEITLKRDGKTLFGFSQLLPEEYRFARPKLAEKLYDEGKAGPWVDWLTDHNGKLVMVGNFESPQDILSLLHETGHAAIDTSSKERHQKEKVIDEWAKADANDSVYLTLLDEEDAKIKSKMERRAWAYAINTMRALAQRFNIDFRTIFPTFESLKTYVNDNLASYRKNHEWAAEKDPEFEKELKRLFDRGQYKA